MQNQDINKKTKQFIDKNADLLNEKKYYQFAQKIKLVANRKLQTKKNQQAQSLFRLGADALYSIQQVQKQAPFELMVQLTQLYQKQPSLLTEESQRDLIRILQKKAFGNQQINLIRKIMQKTGRPQDHLIISTFYIDYHIQRKQYAKVERIVYSLSSQKSWQLTQAWKDSVKKQQVPALWCRMVLWRGIFHSINDAQQTFQVVREVHTQQNPYFVFTGFLLKTIALNSRSAYQAMQRSYAPFLESDVVFSALFTIYGQKYFKIQKKKGGLLGFLQ